MMWSRLYAFFNLFCGPRYEEFVLICNSTLIGDEMQASDTVFSSARVKR